MPAKADKMMQVREQIADLPNRSRDEVVGIWRQELSDTPPRQMSRVMMMRILAFALQAKASNGLPRRLARKLERALDGKTVRPTAPSLNANTRLYREWNGVTHIVEVVDASTYRWREREYRSLSAIAKAITGSHWSGPRFFGLTHRKAA